LHKKADSLSILCNQFDQRLWLLSNLPQLEGVVIALLKSIQPNYARGTAIADPLLCLKLFGPMQALDAVGRNILPRSRKTRAVLAVLALAAPKPVLRSRLTGLLWSQRAREQARGSLRQSVHELQRALRPGAGTLLQTDRHHLALSDNGLWVDVCVATGAAVTDPAGVQVFQSTLLDDLDGLDPAFDGWLGEQRQRVKQLALSITEAVLAAASETKARIVAAEQLLTIDRVHESAWQTLIRAHLELGNRDAARLAFERCSTTLSHAGLAPSRETEALVRSTSPAPKGTKARAAGKAIRLCVMHPRALDRSGMDALLPGLAEEITAAVSRFRWISCFVDASHANQISPSQRDPAVVYLLDSTLQRSGKRSRIIVRLLDLHAGSDVIWARRFDRELDDVLMLQGELAAEVAAQIDPELLLREGERRIASEPGEPTAFDLTLRAIPAIYRLEPAGFHLAGELLAAAASIEPGNAAALAWWAYWHLFLVGQAWAKDAGRATLRAGELAERAVTLDPGDARALTLVGHVRGFLHKRAEEACALHERALSLNPNLPLAWCFSGLTHCYLGRHEMAIEQIARAQHLSPHDPHAFFFDMALMMPHFLRGEFDQALALGRRAVELNPGFSSTYKGYLATLGQLGHDQEARRILARLHGLEPGFSVRNAIERSPMTRRCDLKLYADGLRRAGLPEG
jgi:DNA-binding SARP family transcriptional activator